MQLLHTASPPPLKVPAGHGAPSLLLDVLPHANPGAAVHGLHTGAAASEYVPGAHATAVVLVESCGHAYPAAHGTPRRDSDAVPFTHAYPASQFSAHCASVAAKLRHDTSRHAQHGQVPHAGVDDSQPATQHARRARQIQPAAGALHTMHWYVRPSSRGVGSRNASVKRIIA